MKANEAPEKIYIPRLEGNKSFVHEWSATKFRKYFSREIAENVEYTRTDAFIEKACEFLDGVIYDYIELKHANVDTFMDVDNKRFIEDFRNYMKGE